MWRKWILSGGDALPGVEVLVGMLRGVRYCGRDELRCAS